MDINFHYFAVKTLAHFAGFLDVEAQRIAEFSQYIDDYNWYFYINCKNIPDYARYDEYDLVINSPLSNFNPAQTGFSNWFDYAILAMERNQKFIVSPFHFVPYDKYSTVKSNRTVPGVPRDGSMIDKMIWRVIHEYTDRSEMRLNRQVDLMRLGMLLHTFADTYAHQLFSGYNSSVNDVKVTRVINNITGQDITTAAQAEIDTLINSDANNVIPPVGHCYAGSTPDLTHISFTMLYKDDVGSGYLTHTRSNTDTFVEACRHIYNYLGKCSYRPDVPDEEWTPLAERLRQAFLIEMPKKDVVETLTAHWKSVFPEVRLYYYDKDMIESRFKGHLKNEYTEEFYRYNCMADRILVELYGNKSRERKGPFSGTDEADEDRRV